MQSYLEWGQQQQYWQQTCHHFSILDLQVFDLSFHLLWLSTPF
jgi:hypothetical protein